MLVGELAAGIICKALNIYGLTRLLQQTSKQSRNAYMRNRAHLQWGGHQRLETCDRLPRLLGVPLVIVLVDL